MRIWRELAIAVAAAVLAGVGFAHAQVFGGPNSGYPPGSNPISAAFAGNVNAGAGTASIPAAVGKFSYLCGVSALNNGATAAAAGATLTISGLEGGTTYTFLFPFGTVATPTFTLFSGATGLPAVFTPCLVSNALNTAITVTVAAQAGNTQTDINVWGYQR